MKTKIQMNPLPSCLVGALVLGLGALGLHAQPGPGFPGFGGGASSSATRSSSRSSTTTYPASTDIGQARITYDPETRSIIVVADEDTAANITNMVRQLDRPAPQVLINCVFLEATYTKGLDLGVEGTYKHTISGAGILNTPTGSEGSKVATAFDLATTGGMYTLAGQNLDITLAALAKSGRMEILSRPSILARNNQQATITIGQQVPLVTGVTYDNFGNQRNAISYQNVGIILRVTPFITSDGMVEMIVAPEISSVSDSTVNLATGGSTNNTGSTAAPLINIRSADTVVVTPDKQTVVIGGLMQNQKVKTENKVPVLGSIPLIGNLFKHKVTSDAKTELLIFLTPTIVRDPRELAMMSEAEKSRTRDSRKAFTEDELNRYLDRPPPASGKPSPLPSPRGK